MDQVVDFMRDFIKAEHTALLSMYTERDAAGFAAKREKLDTFYAPDVPSDLKAPVTRDAAYFEQSEAALDKVQPRVLFQIKHYHHPKLGDLYRCYLTSNVRSSKKTNYFANLYVAAQHGTLQIVAQYLICLDCDGTGKVAGQRCPECTGKGWDYFYGVQVTHPGELVDVRKLHKPDNPQQQADYDAA